MVCFASISKQVFLCSSKSTAELFLLISLFIDPCSDGEQRNFHCLTCGQLIESVILEENI